jgi:hypothetical protein
MESLYDLEMRIEQRARETSRLVDERRSLALIDVPPSPVRRAIASAIVRFGIFLNGREYHCPDAPDTAMGARPTG